jgi:hypothetical protein
MHPLTAPILTGFPAIAARGGDRRASERVPLRRGALLELAGCRWAAVNLLDLSEGGAALLADGVTAEPGLPVALMIDTARLPAIVVAVSDGRVHLAFRPLKPAAEAALRRLLGHPSEPNLVA